VKQLDNYGTSSQPHTYRLLCLVQSEAARSEQVWNDLLPTQSSEGQEVTTPPFERFVSNPFSGRLVTLDPGETTGFSVWDDSKLVDTGHLMTKIVRGSVIPLQQWIANLEIKAPMGPTYFVVEEYRVYGHKTEDHAQNDMHTSRLIGCIETLLTLRGIGYEMRGASFAKGFADDQKLEDWGFWKPGFRHARDAIRHGCYFLCLGKPPKL
jgi:hypothetical protein